MHVAKQFAEGYIMLEIEHVTESLYFGGVVVEHEQDAGKGKDDEEIEGDTTHAPGITVPNRVTIDFCRMEMQEDVGKHAQRTIARRFVVFVPEDGGVKLGLSGLAEPFHLLLGLGREVFLKRGRGGLDCLDGTRQQAGRLAVPSVRVVLLGHLRLSCFLGSNSTSAFYLAECSLYCISSYRQKGPRIIELARLALGPLVEARSIHDDLPVGREFHVRTIHRTRRRPFEVYAFVVISAAMTGTFELVLTGLPIGCAAKMLASRVDDGEKVGRFVHPDEIFLLPISANSQRVVRGITNFENCGRFEKCARKKKTKESNKPRAKETGNGAPHQAASAFVGLAVLRSD